MPKISVLMPVYNCEAYIAESLGSVLKQDFEDFEVLIIDDCSSDRTVEIINSFQDDRIILKCKTENTGYSHSLNWGIDNAKGEYIARMDADDICLPVRFGKQLNFLEQHNQVALCGTNAQIIGRDFYYDYPLEGKKIAAMLLLGSALIHPSIMGRREIFEKYRYDNIKEPAEDYDLYVRMVIDREQIANLPEVLLKYRMHEGQISKRKKKLQNASLRVSMLKLFQLFEYDRGRYNDAFVMNAIFPQKKITIRELRKIIVWYNSLIDVDRFFDAETLKVILFRKKYNVINFYHSHPYQIVDRWRKIYLLYCFISDFPILYLKKLKTGWS